MSPASSPASSQAPSGPTSAEQRLPAPDVLRGFALLGLVVMNIGSFASPRGDPTYVLPAGADALVSVLRETLFDGRMRGLFSMLFGAGLVLAVRRGRADLADVHGRRCLGLQGLGMVHAYLMLWPGDILFVYGVCGLLLFPFRRLAPGRLLALALVVLAVIGVKTWAEIDGQRQTFEEGAAVASLAEAGATLDEEQQERLEGHQAWWARQRPDAETLAERTATLRSGWWTLLQDRLDPIVERQSRDLYLWSAWDALAAMLLGMALARWGLLTGDWPLRRLLVLTGLGYAVGLGLSLPSSLAWHAGGHDPTRFDIELWHWLPYDVARLATALGHAGLLLALLRAGRLAWLTRRLAAAGRLALSVYMGQTLVYVLVFTGVGLGLAGELSASAQAGVALGMGALVLLLAPAWLARWRMGPMEWLLRRVAYGARPSVDRRARAVPAPRAAAEEEQRSALVLGSDG